MHFKLNDGDKDHLFSYHFKERVEERLGSRAIVFYKQFIKGKYLSKVMFKGRYKSNYKNQRKKEYTHILLKHMGELFVIIKLNDVYTTILTLEYYQQMTWAVNTSEHVKQLNEKFNKQNQKAAKENKLNNRIGLDPSMMDSKLLIDKLDEIGATLSLSLKHNIVTYSTTQKNYPNPVIPRSIVINILNLKKHTPFKGNVMNRIRFTKSGNLAQGSVKRDRYFKLLEPIIYNIGLEEKEIKDIRHRIEQIFEHNSPKEIQRCIN